MGTSYCGFRKFIVDYLKDTYSEDATILDVGPGIGTYYYILNHYFKKIDCVEIYKPYIDEYNLKSKYQNVYNCDILGFDLSKYDVVIMGDVLEHISIKNSTLLIDSILKTCKEVIVVVPWQYKQGEINGNIYEAHKQDDLTKDVMLSRYQNLKCIKYNDHSGVFVKC